MYAVRLHEFGPAHNLRYEQQDRAIRAAADGLLRPLITRYPLSRAGDAHADLENRRTAGKVVLTP